METLVNSLSDGACDVAGVSCSEGAAIVEVSDGGARTVSSSSSTCCATAAFPLAGRAMFSMAVKFCRFLRLPAARGGKFAFPPSFEYHGSVG